MTDINNNNNNDNSVAIRSNSIILQYVMEHIIPFHDVDIVDAVITVSGMVKAGLINLATTAATVNDNDTDTDTGTIDFENATQFEVNEETKKITRLVLARDTSSNNNNNETQGNENNNNNNNNQWELPLDIICRLEMLESLDLSLCGSISSSSSTTTNMINSSCYHLKRLDLQYTYLQQRQQQQQQQQHTSSSNGGGGEEEEEDDNNNYHLFDFLPNLECIKFGSYEGEHIIDSVLNDIIQQQHKQKQQQQQGVSFLNKNLHNISFNYCTEFNERHLETILFHILPEASKLTTLDLWSNQIHTVQRIAARIKRTTTERSQTDPMERDALMTILRTFKGICNLEYLLRINHAGRRLVEGNIDDDDHDDHDGNNYNSNNNKQPRIPISLWPIILERSYKKSNHIYGKDFRYGKEMRNHDGLFYLIRHGAVLQHIMCIQEENNNTKSTILSRKSS
ncbi:hypothetical protein FRACYDRAFT_234706 [Fragilariopsis cylindrus CCMP1102]|uniref:Uncharacterized protein n=1 Tax=Fragilariopsis cylindrus CCMP1102 TaxID=635003 RepID=A0A1E7FSD1_9STRA|nr:hypothetical protein FRACYDRAFT_234706 [Fragilariopsis cylindrus CCMP1102]|eukprot:OEU21080.1 hypothetical protein FRACYDRAFT_234706 [Fragilariopsis cylindrus CCMP1102]